MHIKLILFLDEPFYYTHFYMKFYVALYFDFLFGGELFVVLTAWR